VITDHTDSCRYIDTGQRRPGQKCPVWNDTERRRGLKCALGKCNRTIWPRGVALRRRNRWTRRDFDGGRGNLNGH
jgi:hypothetical protein